MFLLRAVSGLALCAAVVFPVHAQSLPGLRGPAELPPESFTDVQYVDSRGCVFIRAGYGGQETWVPRVTRDRQPLCGYQPSLSGNGQTATAAATPAPAAEPQEAPEQTAAVPTPPARPATSPAPAARPAPATAVAAPAQQAPQHRVASCQGLPSGASQYMQGSGVRCGPQPTHPSGGMAVAGHATGSGAPPQLQLAPVVIPEGYRQAWEDGRLNAARGLAYATPEGDAAMAALWSDTVPRVAVDPAADGVPVSYSAAGTVVTRASSTPELTATAGEETAAPQTIRIPAGHSYVEIARYSDRDSADAARRALQRQGMETQLGGVSRGGELRAFLVLAGPFAEPEALARALTTARRLGYSGAVTR